MLRDTNIAITQHALTSERVSREVRYLSDNLEFSANAATLFLPTPVNRGFISWEDHYQFYPLESLLASNRIQKRPANSRKPTGIKQHTCYFESPPSQELTLPPIVRNNGSTKSAGTRRIKARRSNFSVHSIPMDPSVDWVNTISSAVDNFETVYLKSDSLTRLSPDPSVSVTSPTDRHTPDARVPEFLAEWETGQKPVFQPLSSLTEEIVLGNGLRFDKILEPILPARQCHFNEPVAREDRSHGRTQGQRRWQAWPRPHRNVRNEGWLSVVETRELEEEREEQRRGAALSLANKKIDTYATSGAAGSKESEGSEFFLEEETGFRESRIVEEWLQKWSLPTQFCSVSDIAQQLSSVNQLVRVQGAGMCVLSLPGQGTGAELDPQLEEPLQRLLSDESMRVRLTAATVLSFSAFEDKAALKQILMEGVGSSDPQERWLSCQALACLLVPAPSVLTELSARLVSDSPRERARALTLMGRLSPHSCTVHAIAADLVTGVHWKRKIAGCSLVPLLSGGPKKDFQERLIRIMWGDWHSKVREAAARALGRAGKAKLIHDEIRTKLTDLENEDLRLDALHKIRELKPPIRLLIPGLLACLEDKVISIRISCIKLVAELQIRDETILDSLIELLKDDSWKVKLESINTLSQLSGSVSSPQLIVSHLLWAGRFDRVSIVRLSALRTLSMLARDLSPTHSDLRAEIVNALIDALSSDTEDSVREEAERGLLTLGEEPRREDKLLEAIREEIKKLGQPAEIAATILQSS